MLSFGKGIGGLALAFTVASGTPAVGLAQVSGTGSGAGGLIGAGVNALNGGAGGSGAGSGSVVPILNGNNNCAAICSTNGSTSSSNSTTVANNGNTAVNSGNVGSSINSGNVVGHEVVVGTRVFEVPTTQVVTTAVPVAVAANTGGAALGG